MDDALELLGPGFEDGRVRAFAVKQLARADDEVRLYTELGTRHGLYLSRRNCNYTFFNWYKRSNSRSSPRNYARLSINE